MVITSWKRQVIFVSKFEKQTIEKQLLLRAVNSPYISKNILGSGVSVLLKDPINQEIGFSLVRYYASSSELITENTLNSMLENKFDIINKKKARQNEPLVSQEDLNEYFLRVKELFSNKEDSNSKLESSLNTYIHDELTTAMIAAEVQKGLDNLSSRVTKGIDKINELNIGSGSIETIDFFNDTEEKAKLYSEFKEDKIPFDIPSLDKVTRGGLERGQVALFAATSGGGKTAFLTNLSYYFSIKAKRNVLHVTLEEKKGDQALRLDRMVLNSGIEDTFDLDGGVKSSFINKVTAIYPKVNPSSHGALRIIKTTPNSLDVDGLRQLIVSYTRKDKINYDVIILDYADLLKQTNDTFGHESEAGQRLFQNLAKLAGETNTLLITGSQLNRNSWNSDIKTISDVEGSYRKINICSFVGTINTTDEEKTKGFFRIYLDKCRNSYGYPDKLMYMKYDLHSMKFHEDNNMELLTHKSLVSGKSNADFKDVKKENSKQNMIDAINASIVE